MTASHAHDLTAVATALVALTNAAHAVAANAARGARLGGQENTLEGRAVHAHAAVLNRTESEALATLHAAVDRALVRREASPRDRTAASDAVDALYSALALECFGANRSRLVGTEGWTVTDAANKSASTAAAAALLALVAG